MKIACYSKLTTLYIACYSKATDNPVKYILQKYDIKSACYSYNDANRSRRTGLWTEMCSPGVSVGYFDDMIRIRRCQNRGKDSGLAFTHKTKTNKTANRCSSLTRIIRSIFLTIILHMSSHCKRMSSKYYIQTSVYCLYYDAA